MVDTPTLLRFAYGEEGLVQPKSQFNKIKTLRNQFADADLTQGACAVKIKNDHLVETASHCPSNTKIFYNETYYNEHITPEELQPTQEVNNRFCFVVQNFKKTFWSNRYDGVNEECRAAYDMINDFLTF